MGSESGSTAEESNVDCPLCDDFVGGVKSVQQHITRKTDESHKGEDGSDHVAELTQKAKERAKGAFPDDPFDVSEEIDDGDKEPFGPSEIEHANKGETDDGELTVSVTGIGSTALFLWWLAQGAPLPGDNL